jgi:nucleotide-binding universal stress UspA family protein
VKTKHIKSLGVRWNLNSPRLASAKRGTRPGHGHTVLVPTDFSEESLAALRYAMPLARRLGARISLLHVIAPVVAQVDYGYGPVSVGRVSRTVFHQREQRLNELARQRIATRWRGSVVVCSGPAAAEIARAAGVLDAKLIVMGGRAPNGSCLECPKGVAATVMRLAPCPVLTVPWRLGYHDEDRNCRTPHLLPK